METRSPGAATPAPIIVQKFGGTSVDGPRALGRARSKILAAVARGFRVVVVVSAPGDTTDRLVTIAREINARPGGREMDRLLSTGEHVSMALMAMALEEAGQRAASFSGRQAGIITDGVYGRAAVLRVEPVRIKAALKAGYVAVVAGFQGISPDGDVTTLGRGGSDLTAVILAKALGAEVCEIYTDVAGVYTADPRIVKDARPLTHISHEEMLELASHGAQVLQARAIEHALRLGVTLRVVPIGSDTEEGASPGDPDPYSGRSIAFASGEAGDSDGGGQRGTWIISPERPEAGSPARGGVGISMHDANDVTDVYTLQDRPVVTGVTCDTDTVRITARGLPDGPGVSYDLFEEVARRGINVDLIIQGASEGGRADLSFTVASGDLPGALEAARAMVERSGGGAVGWDEDVAKVSIVGAGMMTTPGVAARMFGALGDAGINIKMISCSEIKVSCVIARSEAHGAVKSLHAAFELHKM